MSGSTDFNRVSAGGSVTNICIVSTGLNAFCCTCRVPSSSWRRISCARCTTATGNPANWATWIPYDLSAPPGMTLCRKTTVPPSSLTATL